jgi:signal transduction histidine kinase
MTNNENLVKHKIKDDILPSIKSENKANDYEERLNHDIKLIIDRNKKILAVIGHDIKTPISSIIGLLTTLKENIHKLDKGRINNYINNSLFSAKNSLILLDNLLEWAFAESSLKKFCREYVNINKLLKEVIEEIQFYASSKLISIETIDIPTENVFIDKNMIKTVLRNLLNNAIKYTNIDGEIVVSAIRSNEYLEVSIKDNGIGLSEEALGLIFKSGNPNSTTGIYNETVSGFGLLLCKEFLDIHKGEIRIFSKLGEGSEFKFSLPLNSK